MDFNSKIYEGAIALYKSENCLWKEGYVSTFNIKVYINTPLTDAHDLSEIPQQISFEQKKWNNTQSGTIATHDPNTK